MALVMAQHCVSNEPWFATHIMSDTHFGKVYTVWIPMPGLPQEEYICTCQGFLFRGKCKHQARVNPCLWHELVGPEKQTDEQREKLECPRCGNATVKEIADDGS